MEQYQHQPSNRVSQPIKQPIKQPVGPSIAEQQLMAVVQRLSTLVEQQARQVRRLENDVQQLREAIVRSSS